MDQIVVTTTLNLESYSSYKSIVARTTLDSKLYSRDGSIVPITKLDLKPYIVGRMDQNLYNYTKVSTFVAIMDS